MGFLLSEQVAIAESVAKEEHGIEPAALGTPEFHPASLRFHQFLHDGEAQARAPEIAALIRRSPEAVERAISLLVGEARTFVDDMDGNDGTRSGVLSHGVDREC